MASFSKLGKYIIRRELGKGAMGVVYEGFDPVIERTVAIKTILPQQLSGAEAEGVLARFKREAQAAGRLNHPGIVAVYDYGEAVADDDHTMLAANAASRPTVVYIAMEFVKGRELRDFFEANERFTLRDAERIMSDILDALGHAHANGVVHRDMKPANLIVLADGRIKIADFGIARVEKSDLTQAGTVMGTPSYMSPEQFMGQTVDGRSDIFSCGVILYQFLTGEKPFTGNTTTIMYKVLREEPLAPSMLNVALPAALDAVVRKAMAKNPDDRYQSAQEFAQAIKYAMTRQADNATVVNASAAPTLNTDSTVINQAAPAAVRPPVAVTVPTASPPPAVAPAAAPKSRQPALIASAAIVAAVLGVGGYVFFGKTAGSAAPLAQVPATGAATAINAAPAATPGPAAAAVVAGEPVLEAGTMVISALGLVDPKDPRFNGDAAAAQSEARADARRQLIEKALGLYVEPGSLNKNYAVLEQKLLSQSGSFIKNVILESAPTASADGLIGAEARAVVRVRDVQRSLNQLSKDERIEFIRNNGDPKVSVSMTIRNADTAQAMAAERSLLAENVVKGRVKSFGFRIWSADGAAGASAKAKPSDFHIEGEIKVKTLSAKLPASGLIITKTALTSWTLKAIDKASGEEVYLNTVNPAGKSWANEDLALADIGKLVGDEFSKNFFLEHFNFGAQKIGLNITGLPDAQLANMLLRELRGFRQVLDAQLVADSGKYQLVLPEGSASDMVAEGVLKPLNGKLGQNCFAMAGSSGSEVNVTFSTSCAEAAVRNRFAAMPPAGLLSAPDSRGKPLLKAAKAST